MMIWSIDIAEISAPNWKLFENTYSYHNIDRTRRKQITNHDHFMIYLYFDSKNQI